MLIRRTVRGPSTGAFQIAVRTVLPSQRTSRGTPTLTDRTVLTPRIVRVDDTDRFITVMQPSSLRILAICCSSLFVVGLDTTAVNVALPSIGRDLDTGVSGLQWTMDAYTLVLASLLMLGGSTGDRLGRKRVFVTGLAVFSLASLLCSLAPSAGALVAFRALQAVGGAMLNPVA